MRNTDIFQCWLKDFKFILIRNYLFMSSCEEIPTLLRFVGMATKGDNSEKK